MSAAGFLAVEGAVGHGEGHAEHLLGAVGVDELGVRTNHVLDGHLEGALVEFFKFGDGGFHVGALAEDADLGRHDFLHAGAQFIGVFRAAVVREGLQASLFLGKSAVDEGRRDVDAVFSLVAEVGDEFADDHAGHDGFSNGVAAEAVEAVHVPTGRFAGGKETLERRRFAGRLRAHAAHGVVLSRTDGHPFLRRVNAEEVVADFVDFAQLVLDVMFAKQRDVEPDVFAEAALHTLALGNAFFHAAGDHVAGSEFLLFRFNVRHEAVTVNVAQKTAVAAAAFRHENAGREDAGRVELNGFHVAEGGDARFEREVVARAFADDGVCRHAIDAAGTAGGDCRGLGNIGHEFAGDEATDDGAVATLAVVNQREGFNAFDDRNLFGDDAVGNSVEHGVAGTVGHIAGTPLLRAAEVALGDEAGGFLAFGNGDLLTVDDDLTVTRGDAAPGHAPSGELAHGLRGGVHEHADDFLVGTPVGAADRVAKVNVFVVADALDDVAERSLHAALGSLGVAALRRNQRQDDRVMPTALGSNGHTQTGKTATDHEHVGVDNFHFQWSPRSKDDVPGTKALLRQARHGVRFRQFT